jgi:hypothetical protein
VLPAFSKALQSVNSNLSFFVFHFFPCDSFTKNRMPKELELPFSKGRIFESVAKCSLDTLEKSEEVFLYVSLEFLCVQAESKKTLC